MTVGRPPAKYHQCRHGYKPGDEVWTPLRRKAILTRYRVADEKWDARYVRTDGSKSNELDETTLDPAKLVRG